MNTNILIDVKKIPELLQQNFQFIDLRSSTDFKREHLVKFINIPYESFSLNSIVLDKNIPIILLCHTGAKALALAKSLNSQGYHCYSISGGFYSIKYPSNDNYY